MHMVLEIGGDPKPNLTDSGFSPDFCRILSKIGGTRNKLDESKNSDPAIPPNSVGIVEFRRFFKPWSCTYHLVHPNFSSLPYKNDKQNVLAPLPATFTATHQAYYCTIHGRRHTFTKNGKSLRDGTRRGQAKLKAERGHERRLMTHERQAGSTLAYKYSHPSRLYLSGYDTILFRRRKQQDRPRTRDPMRRV
jgi:hypothetical protein